MTLTFDNVDLMASPYIVRYLYHDGWPERRLDMEKRAHERGALLLDTQFGEKVFAMAGKITGATQDELETNIETFKELMSREAQNLDIGYASSTRRYKAYVDELKINRDFYHLLHAPFSLKFIVPSGISINPVAVNDSHDNITDASYSNTITILGSAKPTPTVTLTIDSATTATVAEVTINGDKITITTALVATNVLVIDCENKKVTKDGTEVDYAGIFPRFKVGSNAYTIALTRTACQYDLDIDYFKTYL